MRIPPSGPGEVPGFSAPGLKEVVAQSRLTGAPPFETKTVNDMFRSASKETHNALLGELAADPVSFLKNRFTLSPQQLKNVESLSPRELGLVKKSADFAKMMGSLFGSDCGAGDVSSGAKQEQAERVMFSHQPAAPGSYAAANGFSSNVTLHMQGFEE